LEDPPFQPRALQLIQQPSFLKSFTDNDLTAERAENTEEESEEIALHVLLCGLGVLCGKCI
jgi:hypothetical protein